MQPDPSVLALVVHWIVSGIAVFLTSKVIAKFEVDGFVAAIVAALVIAGANFLIWPVLIFLTLPINIITLGLFTFVVNGAVLKIAAAIMPGFRIKGWLAAIFGSVVLSIFNLVLHYILI